MASVAVTLAHVAVGCNAVSNALCCIGASPSPSPAYCGAFGAKNAVALLTSDSASPLAVAATLQHRVQTQETTRITSVRLLSAPCGLQVLAGDSEGNVLLWRQTAGTWRLLHLSTAVGSGDRVPTASVAAVALAQTRRRLLCFVAFSDGQLTVFSLREGDDDATVLARLELGVERIMETLDATLVSGPGDASSSQDDSEESVLLAAGGVDGKVHLLEVEGGGDALTPLLALEGHHGWIRSVAFQQQQTTKSFLLASASQDQRIRLWKVTTNCRSFQTGNEAAVEVQDGFQAFGATLVYTVSFDALLLGHEDWVTSVQWTQLPHNDAEDASESHEWTLLSSSMDNTLIVWTKPKTQLEAWSPSLRVGEMGGNGLLSAGVLPALDGRLNLVALSFTGQLERWTQQPAPSKLFLPAISVNGHCAPVTDLSWSPRGDYLLSVSLDQTARVLAPVQAAHQDAKRPIETWHEISRAQVHGYDLNCACFLLGNSTTNDRFVSGADEKILRVFEAPDEVQRLATPWNASGTSDDEERAFPDARKSMGTSQQRVVPHAYLPELSLTNKAVELTSSEDQANDGYVALSSSVRLPVGDTLSRKTLWPEQRKLYGHGNELLSVASSHAGDLIASACKSREERYAAVRLWSTTDWSEAQPPLEGHKSSVVQLAFSPNDRYLLSVSKDRQFCVYERTDRKFALVERVKAHRRIIWSCSWSPDSRVFALGSRDQSFSLWSQTAGQWTRATESVALDAAVTAVAFYPSELTGSIATSDAAYLLAVGLETGAIQLFAVSKPRQDSGAVQCTRKQQVPYEISASAAILRLAWTPAASKGESRLAAGSRDHSVRVYDVKL